MNKETKKINQIKLNDINMDFVKANMVNNKTFKNGSEAENKGKELGGSDKKIESEKQKLFDFVKNHTFAIKEFKGATFEIYENKPQHYGIRLFTDINDGDIEVDSAKELVDSIKEIMEQEAARKGGQND